MVPHGSPHQPCEATCRGVLRGAGKQKIGAIANAIGYYAIGLPISITLMFVYKMGVMGLWCGLIICISVQAFSFVVVILRADWKKAAEEAQIRAGLTGHLGTASADHAAQKPVPLATSLTLEADVPNEVALGSAVYRSESQPELQLIPSEEVPVRVVSPAGGALLRKELCFRRGLALLAAVVVLMAGVTVQLLTRNG